MIKSRAPQVITEEGFDVGSRVVISSSHPLFPQESCTITARPSPDAAIVELNSGNGEHIQLKYLQPCCEHNFVPLWQQDDTLIEQCSCGETRVPSPATLSTALEQCLSAKKQHSELVVKSDGRQQQELTIAFELTNKRISLLEEQIKKRSRSSQHQGRSPSHSFSNLAVSHLALGEIRRDGGTQPRAAIDLKHIRLLEEQIEDGKELEPVVVFYDGESYWLADGFHRYAAHKNQEKEAIACVVHQGTRREAVLYSVGANADHKPALPRSREDKRRGVITLLQDPEWGEWSNYKIAEVCRVNEKTVRNIRASLTTDFRSEDSVRTYRTKHGTIAIMKTANIGKFAQELPSLDAAIVELDTQQGELSATEYLKPAIAQHLQLTEGGLVEVYALGNKKINGRWGRIAAVTAYTVDVWLRDIDTMTMQKYTLKYQQVIPLPLEKEPQLKKICDRLCNLRQYNLDPFEVEILNLLERPVVLTPTELEYLAHIEKRHGIVQD